MLNIIRIEGTSDHDTPPILGIIIVTSIHEYFLTEASQSDTYIIGHHAYFT